MLFEAYSALPLIDVIVVCNILKDNKLTDSTSAARRLIQQGSVTVNGKKVEDVNQEFSGDQEYLIKVGKKRFLKIAPG